jgi:NADPH-dependent ferric siderophore reductase
MNTPQQEATRPAPASSAPEVEGLVPRLLTRWLFREASVVHNDLVAPGLHRIELFGPALRGAQWTVGDKLQIRMGSGLQTRTYTPLYWDAVEGRTAILAHALAAGPGSEWVRRAGPGQQLSLFGPRRSLDLSALPAAEGVLVGDETSIGLAAAWRPASTILEVDQAAALQPLLGSLGINATLLAQRDEEHHLERLVEAALAQGPDRHFVLVGRARTIQVLRRALREHGVASGRILTKAYWADGKAGLD